MDFWFDAGKTKSEESCIFGVPLEVAVERSKCHDGVKLPVVVRECIQFIEENGLNVEGIYR
jgi:RalA-binding protein 1